MLRFFTVLIFTTICLLFSCKKDATPSLNNAYAMINQANVKPNEVASMRKAFARKIEDYVKATNSKSITILEKDIWIYEATVKDTSLVPQAKLGGRWIDFKENLTYEYGSDKDGHGSGKYCYDLDKGILILLDDNELMKPQQFEVKSLNDALIIVGSYDSKDNNMQAKLNRATTKPSNK